MKAPFITFEGVDGAGKSTALAGVDAWLREQGLAPLLTREPGGTAVGEQLRAIVLAQPVAPLTEVLLVFAARNEHRRAVIEPALAAGRWVLCDRFTDASYAYQGSGRGVAVERIAALEQWVHPDLQPDLTVLVDLDPALAAARRASAREADRFEAESTVFFARVREGYLQRARAQPERFLLVDGAQEPAVVQSRITGRLRAWLR